MTFLTTFVNLFKLFARTISFFFSSYIFASFICPFSYLAILVFSSKQAVAAGTATHKEATQAMHNGLNGMIHTAVQAGHTAIAAPDVSLVLEKER